MKDVVACRDVSGSSVRARVLTWQCRWSWTLIIGSGFRSSDSWKQDRQCIGMWPDDGVTSGSDSVYVLTPGHQATADKKDTYQLSLTLSVCARWQID